MSELSLPSTAPADTGWRVPLVVQFAWRNLWRNRKRTLLTVGGITFGMLLAGIMMSFQAGMYGAMENSAAILTTGHVQLARRDFVKDGRFADTISGIAALDAELASQTGVVAVLPRVEAFALVSVGERSFGGQVYGVNIDADRQHLKYLSDITDGRLPTGEDEAVIGSLLARNLQASVGDELVLLGSTPHGGVAAMVFIVSGIVETPIAELNRHLVVAAMAGVQAGFEIPDQAHTLVLVGKGTHTARGIQQSVRRALATELEDQHMVVRAWQELMPGLTQSIQADRVGGLVSAGLVLFLVLFTVSNSFLMTVFERTQEFGMLRALGMSAGKIVLLLQWESLFTALIGCLVGSLVTGAVVGWMSISGIPTAGLEIGMNVPDALYPELVASAFLVPGGVLVIGCQLAALLPSLRVFRLQPVEALRDE